ncbi:MAG TPA: phosphopentomutase, partial [Symbiobacteriaceae bacterium]|nr:phosphopentomutase [Symbiobacteriaceae bacterium]
MPDAAEWGDAGSNTLGNIAKKRGALELPTMGKLGIGHLTEIPGTPPEPNPSGAFGKMAIYSQGKDTMTGHWEMVGIKPEAPFRTYPEGFPPDLIEEFCRRAGVEGILGNEVASGTEIIERLGEAHIKTGLPIVYTSADSVFQVAAHEGHFGLDRLYHVCEVARELLQPPHRVGRVIARPFIGEDQASFKRTSNRHDYALVPPHMLLNDIVEAGMTVQAVGKIGDIFVDKGITWGEHTKDNRHGVQMIHDCLDRHEKGLIFANLVDFDMLYGHRRDVEGYANALLDFDEALGPIMAKLGPKDVLIVTADHGNDPTFKGTDHTREYVPVLLWGEAIKPGATFGTRPRLSDLGATIADLLGVKFTAWGESYADLIQR